MDKNKHRLIMRSILRDIYKDELLSSELKFKGGTSAMFFYELPRFSTDLDFDLTHASKQEEIYDRLQEVVKKYGRIDDCANKKFGPIVVLDYGFSERKLKVEVSRRIFDSHYSVVPFSSLLIPVMEPSDMLTHKFCAMRERAAPRDIFDVWFFLSKKWELNSNIIIERTGLDTKEFLAECKSVLKNTNSSQIMMEIGELLEPSMKTFVRNDILSECESLLDDYIEFPLVKDVVPRKHTSLLLEDESFLPFIRKHGIDPSVVSSSVLEELLSGKSVPLKNRKGEVVSLRFNRDKGFGFGKRR